MTAVVEAQEWRPSFPGQRAPFAAGHRLSLRHGAFSQREIEPRAKAILAELIDESASFVAETDRYALEAYSVLQARADLLREWTEEHGMLDANGEPTHAAVFWLRLERQAEKSRSRLGYDPAARFSMLRNAAVAAAVSGSLPPAEDGLSILEQRDDLTTDDESESS